MPSIHVHFLPHLVSPDALAGGTVVVIDVLRATTTITTALAAGASRVIPCREVDEARRVAAALPSGEVLLGGERGGLPIEGFDLGNSPSDYTPDRIAGRTLVFTTTNGTRALERCRQAKRVLLGAFVNLRAVARCLRSTDHVRLLCAGTEGEITREDVLAAGAIAHRLVTPDAPLTAGAWSRCELDDQARIALDAWQATLPPAELPFTEAAQAWLVRALEASRGGRNLVAVGLARDIADCAAADRFDVVGELDLDAWQVLAR
ncbi:MAG: 2-phosphosulfolactate phosphatase [Planctomycetia bacterium]|nr:2-phosphosulfolactate phosphatase [Planctomycetia bacterium]